MIRLMTVNEGATYLSLHPVTVRNLISDGKLRAVRIGRAVRLDINELEGFVKAHTYTMPKL